ncbi:hypothetical protein Hanom_Chr16g01503191 [Helianthus anomalus]
MELFIGLLFMTIAITCTSKYMLNSCKRDPRLPVGLIYSEIVAMNFGESGGHLHLIAYKNHQENRLRPNVYDILSNHSGWCVKYRVQFDALPGSFPDMISQCSPAYDVPGSFPDHSLKLVSFFLNGVKWYRSDANRMNTQDIATKT